MSKARVSYATGERPALSSKQNQQITDYITMALPVFNSSELMYVDNATGGPIVVGVSNKVLGWYPYNPDKNVHTHLRILFGYSEIDGSTFNDLEYTLDSGSTWNNALSGSVAPPVDLGAVDQHMNTIPLASITTFQWIGVRLDITFDLNQSAFLYFFQGFLYNSTDTPF